MKSDFRKISRLQAALILFLGFVVIALSYCLSAVSQNTVGADHAFAADPYIVSNMQRCYTSDTRTTCLQELANVFLDHFSVREILAVFARHAREEAFFTICHETSHFLGQEAYKRADSVAKVYEQTDDTCLGGVFHGTLEGYFMKRSLVLQEGNMPEIAEAVAHICDEVEGYDNKYYFVQCHHGLGHALIYVASDDLPTGLSLCDNLETSADRGYCYTGAFMQNSNNYGSFDHPKAMIKPEDPLYPCPVLDPKYQPMCYTYAVLERYQDNVEKSITLCDMIPEHLRIECLSTFGRNITLYSNDPKVLQDNCAHIEDTEGYLACVTSVADYLTIRYGLTSSIPFTFCQAMDEEDKDTCYGSVGGVARSLTAKEDDIIKFCSAIPEAAYRAVCVTGHI